MEGIKYSIRELTNDVTNEKGHGQTFAIALTDMVSTVLRMNGKEDLFLSPQVLIDANCLDPSRAVNFATNKELGFVSISSRPFIGMRSSNWSLNDYKMSREPRYTIDDVECFFGPTGIKSAILANFSEGGRKYPLLGILPRDDFADRQVAAEAAMGAMPYRFPVNAQVDLRSRCQHSVLIVGVDTTSADPEKHYCEVKGAHGKRWGIDGFSKVGFEVFELLLVPIVNLN